MTVWSSEDLVVTLTAADEHEYVRVVASWLTHGSILVTASETQHLPPGVPVRVSDRGLNKALLVSAISYQANLTKAGNPRAERARARAS